MQNCSATLKPQIPPNPHRHGLFALCVCEAWSSESRLLLYDARKYRLTGVRFGTLILKNLVEVSSPSKVLNTYGVSSSHDNRRAICMMNSLLQVTDSKPTACESFHDLLRR